MKDISNNKGFTLTELLAVIAILSLVLTIVLYTATNVIDNAKEKSYHVTINNVEKQASNYVIENNNSLSWMTDNDSQYQCITVQNLIDKGYFDNDVLKSEVSMNTKLLPTDLVYIERDGNSKTITKNILLVDDRLDYLPLCSNWNAKGSIGFKVEPSGWSQSKKVTIYYRLYDNLNKISSNKYGYEFDSKEYNYNFDKQEQNVILENIESNGIVYASIYDMLENEVVRKTYNIEKIDRIGPRVETNDSVKGIVRNSVTIPLKIYDLESGLNTDSIFLSDIEVYIGTTKVTDISLDKDNYNLIINNNNLAGEVILKISSGQILDNAGNGNDLIEIKTGVSFSNTYTISYNANGGSGAPSSQSKTYGVNLTLSTAKPTRKGYTFQGWNTKSDGSGTNYNSGATYTDNNDIILYAKWTEVISSMCVIADSGLRCRKGPGTSYNSFYVYPYGTEILGYDSDTDGWFYYPDGNCYLSKDYLKQKESKCVRPMYVTAKSGLNCRQGTNKSSKLVTTYSCGTKLYVYESDTDGWFYYPDGNCYLSESYLSSFEQSCNSGGSSSGSSEGSSSSRKKITGICSCLGTSNHTIKIYCNNKNLKTAMECQNYCSQHYASKEMVESTCKYS